MPNEAADALFEQCGRELWLVTAAHEGDRGGLIASFVMKASLTKELPRVAIGIAKHHHTWLLIRRSGSFALHLLGEQNSEFVVRFGLQSGLDVDKLDGVEFGKRQTGSPIVSQTLGWLDCRVETELDIGDRTIFVGEVLDGEATTGPVLKTNSLSKMLSPAHLAEMNRSVNLHAELDSEAIISWRQSRPRT